MWSAGSVRCSSVGTWYGQRNKWVDGMPVIMRTWFWLTPASDWRRQREVSNLSAARLRQGVRSLSQGCQPPGTRQLKRGAEWPGDIGFLAGRRELFGCYPDHLP